MNCNNLISISENFLIVLCKKINRFIIICICLACPYAFQNQAQGQPSRIIELTFDNAVNLALNNSYRTRELQLEIQRSRKLLQAERANLRSRVDMEVIAPAFQLISEQVYNSELMRNVIVQENSRLWQMNLSVRQPVIFFGYPTNGYLSLNNRVYRFTQIGDEDSDVTYYNRYFIEYEQPLFQPNELKNDLERATLDLENEGLEFLSDIVEIIEDIDEEYRDLYETVYKRLIALNQLDDLEAGIEAARANPDIATNAVNQIQVEMANVQERIQQTESNFRMDGAELKQELRLPESDSLYIEPVISIRPIMVDVNQAIAYGLQLRPSMRGLEIEKRRQEIELEEEKGENSFRLNLEATYGREMLDPRFVQLFSQPTNSYTLGVTARIPIWDWGERKARIDAEQFELRIIQLNMEETEDKIRSDIRNAVTTLHEYQERALTMEENLQLARRVTQRSLEDFREGEIGVFELLQNIQRKRDTAQNLLETYLGYRGAIVDLQILTYYDFENNQPLLDRYTVETME